MHAKCQMSIHGKKSELRYPHGPSLQLRDSLIKKCGGKTIGVRSRLSADKSSSEPRPLELSAHFEFVTLALSAVVFHGSNDHGFWIRMPIVSSHLS